MSITKYRRKLALCVAAFFWAGCDSDTSSAAPEVVSDNLGEITSSSSEATAPTSSSEVEAATSSESFDPLSSSSEAVPESSSEAESSSSVNSEYPYTLSTFPNVHCKDSSYFHKSWCPSSKPSLKQAVAEMAENEPLYGIVQPVCQDYDRTINLYTCDNGCQYYPGASNLLQGNTIVQQEYSSIDKKYIPIEQKFAQDSAQAAADTSYPYTLASDTSVHCKILIKTQIGKMITSDTECDMYAEKYYYKCKDGNDYEREDMLQDENGIIKRETPEE